MSSEEEPLVTPKIEQREFVNPVTGSVENLNQITDYQPIETDLESLVEHQHDRSCNIQSVIDRRRKEKVNMALMVSMAAYFVVFVLEIAGVVEVPFGFIVGALCIIGGSMG